MEKLLVVGVDSVVGANLAASLSDRFHVIGISDHTSISIDGCVSAGVWPNDPQRVRQMLAAHRPGRIVVCGVAGDSPWNPRAAAIGSPSAIDASRLWTKAAGELGIAITVISSDAVFSGPWLFHTETSSTHCGSAPAQTLRGWEDSVLAECPHGLVVRTHAYGWSPISDGSGWIEGILAVLGGESAGVFDCVPHGTPILSTDLAEVLVQSWSAGLSGLYHIAGAERANPFRFAQAVAEVFDLAPPRASMVAPCHPSRIDFAKGETSLHTRKIRRALGMPMPLLIDGLQRLRAQLGNGFDRRLCGGRRLVPSKVA